MFPVITNDSTNNVITDTVTVSENGKISYSFVNGDFYFVDGKITKSRDLEYIKTWVDKIVKTRSNIYKIYDATYGTRLLDILFSGLDFDYIKTELKTAITDTLITNSEIISITDFSFLRDKRVLNVTFTVNTIYGSFESGVSA